MLLYKYTSYDIAIKVLENKKIRYTQPIAFNDPFEVLPAANDELNEENIKRLFTSILTEADLNFKYHNAIRAVCETLEESQKRNVFSEGKITNAKKLYENMQLTLGGYIGILSLSSIPDNILLWSHYSDSHNGVAIIIEDDNNYFKNLKKVEYNDYRPTIDLNTVNYSLEDSIKIARQIFYSKSKFWSYENEYRDIKLLSEGSNTTYSDKSGYVIILFDLPIELIKGIIFGCKVVKEQSIQLINKAKDLGYDLTFSSANLNNEKFSLNIEKMNT